VLAAVLRCFARKEGKRGKGGEKEEGTVEGKREKGGGKRRGHASVLLASPCLIIKEGGEGGDSWEKGGKN